MHRLIWSLLMIAILLNGCWLSAGGKTGGTNMQKIYLLPIGKVDRKLLAQLVPELRQRFAYPCEIAPQTMLLPENTYNRQRNQYYSTPILKKIVIPSDAKKVLGIVDVDLYVPRLNFVFGEAQLNGPTAIISIHRLHQEFYKLLPDEKLFFQRTLKEAVHELGHTFGLEHCPNPLCVMHFSNSIIDTDKKQPNFCDKCAQKLH